MKEGRAGAIAPLIPLISGDLGLIRIIGLARVWRTFPVSQATVTTSSKHHLAWGIPLLCAENRRHREALDLCRTRRELRGKCKRKTEIII